MKRIVFLVALAAAASCFVDRKSSQFECAVETDCGDGRTCREGYCIVDDDDCPERCNGGCNLGECDIICNAVTDCGEVVCPPGLDCDVTCDGPGACGNVVCHPAEDCQVTCITTGSCGSIVCGNESCDVRCEEAGSCGRIDCASSCACDVDCDPGDCGDQICPSPNNGDACESLGACSSDGPACDRC